MAKKTRGRASKLELLPDDVQERINTALRDKQITQLELVDMINHWLDDRGIEIRISRSGLNRYATRMETVGSRIREARAISEQWIAQLGKSNEGDVAKVVIEMIRTMIFDVVMKMSTDDENINPEAIKELSTSIYRLERAASENQKRELEIRKEFAGEITEEIEKAAKESGLSDETVTQIKTRILGII